MLGAYRKKSPIHRAVFIKGEATESGYKLLSEKEVDEFAKLIKMDWFWDSRYGEVKFDVPASKHFGVPVYSVMMGYYAVSDGTPKTLRVYDELGFKMTFEEVNEQKISSELI